MLECEFVHLFWDGFCCCLLGLQASTYICFGCGVYYIFIGNMFIARSIPLHMFRCGIRNMFLNREHLSIVTWISGCGNM